MTVTAWRMLKRRHLVHAFDGEGARLYGGRWNSPGIPVCYAAEHVSLAALEILIHLQAIGPLESYVVIPVSFSPKLVTRITEPNLPKSWKTFPSPPKLRQLGDAWLKKQRSVVLEVPSVVVPRESNYLLNPEHPGFSKVKWGKPEFFGMDARLRKF